MSFFFHLQRDKDSSRTPQRNVMATERNQPQVGNAVSANNASPPSNGSRLNREAKHCNNGSEAWRNFDQPWLSNQRSSPSLLFYRKLSCDSVDGTIMTEEHVDFKYSSLVLNEKERLFAELSTVKNIEVERPAPKESLEGSLWKLENFENFVDSRENKTGSTHCSCGLSNSYTCTNAYSCHSSSPSPSSSPTQCRHLSSSSPCPNKRRVRRGSLPVSMLTFHKVIRYWFWLKQRVHFYTIISLFCFTVTLLSFFMLLYFVCKHHLTSLFRAVL